jgi:hypothetical protein
VAILLVVIIALKKNREQNAQHSGGESKEKQIGMISWTVLIYQLF